MKTYDELLDKNMELAAVIRSLRANAREDAEQIERLKHERDDLLNQLYEAQEEIKCRIEAITNASTRIDELKAKSNLWFDRAKSENENWIKSQEKITQLEASLQKIADDPAGIDYDAIEIACLALGRKRTPQGFFEKTAKVVKACRGGFSGKERK